MQMQTQMQQTSAAQDNAWQQPALNTSLTGLRMEDAVDMYVENIERRLGDQIKDIADRVRRYCREKGIRIMHARIVTNRRCDDIVGCHITVPMRQIDDVIGNQIWPSNVNCGRWRNQQGARAERRQPGWDENGRNMDNNPDGGNYYENDYYDKYGY